VDGIPGADNEYEAYAGKICAMLNEGPVNRDELVKYLYQSATGHMGLAGGAELLNLCISAAERIIELNSQFNVQ
jgi:hypothetical protein